MKMTYILLDALKKNKYLRGKLKIHLEKTQPVTLAYVMINRNFGWAKNWDSYNFISQFTEDQVATNGWASFMYSSMKEGRFEKGEEAMKNNWGGMMSPSMWTVYVNIHQFNGMN